MGRPGWEELEPVLEGGTFKGGGCEQHVSNLLKLPSTLGRKN